MTEKEKMKLKKLVKDLDAIRGRHTELVTVYIPAGYSFNEIISQLRSEQSTAENIKSKSVRKNVTAAIDKIIRNLQLYKRPPKNGLVVFCGNASEKEGESDIQFWAIEPPEELNTKLYWCSQRFDLGPLIEMVEEKEIYAIICMDRQEADVALVIGKKIKSLVHMESFVPGKARAGGQCLMPDSLVLQADGDITEIKDVAGDLATIDFQTFRIKSAKTLDKWETKKNQLYKIVTKRPHFEIKCSKDHILFVRGADRIEEKAAEDLKVGDFLLVPERISAKTIEQDLDIWDCFQYSVNPEGLIALKQARLGKGMFQRDVAKQLGVHQVAISKFEKGERNFRLRYLKPLCFYLGFDPKNFIRTYCSKIKTLNLPEKLTPEFAQMVGYFIGDGNFEPDRLNFSEQRRDVAEWYFNKLRTIFNAEGSIRFRDRKNYWQIRIYGRPLVRLFRKLLKNKHSIPEAILKSPDDVLAAFLKGLFDAEGYVSVNNISLGGMSEKLLRQLQIALLRFGILSGIHEYDSRKNPYSKKHRFTVRLCDKESMQKFVEHIGFTSKEKESKSVSLAIASGVSYSRMILPSGNEIYKLIQKYSLNTSNFPRVGTGGFFRGEKQISKVVFNRSIVGYAPETLKKELQNILEYNLLPVKIAKIEKIRGVFNMVDLSVENQNFIANGLVVHNSAMRFERVREGLLHDWYKEIAEAANRTFVEHKEVIGILVSGTGPTKEYFLKEELLHADFKKKILGTVDTSYTGEYGLEETLERGQELIKEATITKEKNFLQGFLTELQKPSGLAVYGLAETINAVKQGAVGTVIASESVQHKHVEYECGCKKGELNTLPENMPKVCHECNQSIKITNEMDMADYLEELAGNYGTKFILVSADTREGQQFLALSGVGGFLRYRI